MKKSYKQWGYLAVDVEHNGSYDTYIPIITDADYWTLKIGLRKNIRTRKRNNYDKHI